MATAARCLCTLALHAWRETPFEDVAGRTAYRLVSNTRGASPAEKRYLKTDRELAGPVTGLAQAEKAQDEQDDDDEADDPDDAVHGLIPLPAPDCLTTEQLAR